MFRLTLMTDVGPLSPGEREREVWCITIQNTTLESSTPERGNYTATQFAPDGEVIDEAFVHNLLRGQGDLLLPTEVLKQLRAQEEARS